MLPEYKAIGPTTVFVLATKTRHFFSVLQTTLKQRHLNMESADVSVIRLYFMQTS